MGERGGERGRAAGRGRGARARRPASGHRAFPPREAGGAGAAPRGQGPGTGGRAGTCRRPTFSPSEAPVRGARRRSYRRRRGSLSVDEKPVREGSRLPASPGRICPRPPCSFGTGRLRPQALFPNCDKRRESPLSVPWQRRRGPGLLDASWQTVALTHTPSVGFHNPGSHCCSSLCSVVFDPCTPVDRNTRPCPPLS